MFAAHQDLLATMSLVTPIFFLLSCGLWMTLRSGLEGARGSLAVRRIAANLSQLGLTLAMWLLALIAVQRLVGFRLSLLW